MDFYTSLLETSSSERTRVYSATVKEGPMISTEHRKLLIEDFTKIKIKTSLWVTVGDKAPGPDRYNSQFFKDCWDIIKEVLLAGVMEFFKFGRILKIWNATVLTLIPKKDHAETVGDYRPIACCYTIYNIVSKMLSIILKKVLPDIISVN
uniref:Uncharacterized protein n=1 Tax=Nicotiana tabacum TaxID=4097 RepID=A0A1S4DC99_TOBAC|nr:PREDICTED: uncharacterized protein LOC107828205 [Nicotiana tabacum]